jgi:mRNA interferase MazF
MKAGEIYWVEFPAGAGRAQAGRRPAVIMQNDAATARLPTVLVVPLTTQQDALRFPGTVLIEPDKQNRLPQPSVALLFQLTSLDQKFLGKRLGRLAKEAMPILWAAFDEIAER